MATTEPAFNKPKRGRGRPPALNTIIDTYVDPDTGNTVQVTVGDSIVRTLAAGGYVETAAALAGVSRGSLHGWLRDGTRVRQRLTAGAKRSEFTAHELRCAEFSRAVEQAQARALTEDLAKHAQVARGGLTVRKSTTKSVDGKIVETRETVETLAPNAHALEWRIERRHPNLFGPTQRLEVSGPDGGDIPVSVRAARLVEHLQDFRARRGYATDPIDTTATEVDPPGELAAGDG